MNRFLPGFSQIEQDIVKIITKTGRREIVFAIVYK